MDKESVRSDIKGIIQAPSSKSYAQRAIAAALLSQGETTLLNMELCSDTSAALSVASSLGASAKQEGESKYIINGGLCEGRLNPKETTINIGESGLSTRMFTPISSLSNLPVTITGKGSILSRPVDMMIDPLRNLGVEVRSNKGYLPITVKGPIIGGETYVDGSVSSQFITGLLMTLPLAESDTTIYVNKPASVPYLDMTIDLLASFGIEVSHSDYTEFYVRGNQQYQPLTYNIEGDWSGASCLLVAGAIAGEVTMNNLNPLSMQADVAIIEALSRAGAGIESTPDSVTVRKRELNAFNFDATQCPDLFPALVALASQCEGLTEIKGTGRLTHKESNRAETLKQEFGKMGIEVDTSEPDVMTVVGGSIKSCVVDSHNDHRIAMATAVAGLCSDNCLTIQNAEAVNKSYPDFWEDLFSLMVK